MSGVLDNPALFKKNSNRFLIIPDVYNNQVELSNEELQNNPLQTVEKFD